MPVEWIRSQRNVQRHSFLRHGEQRDPLAESLEIGFMGIALDEARSAFDYYTHTHANHELIFVDRGEYRCLLNGRDHVLGPGQLLVACPGDTHQDQCRPQLRYYTLWYELRHAVAGGSRESIRLLGNRIPEAGFPVRQATHWPALAALMAEHEHGDAFALSVQNAMGTALFWRVLRDLPSDAINPLVLENSRESHLRFRLFRVFERYVRHPVGVAQMAADLDMSESSLAHRCRNELGLTPARAFTEYRIEQACSLLRSTMMSVKEVAATMGYPDPCHFSHVFKSVRGVTPGAYRDGSDQGR